MLIPAPVNKISFASGLRAKNSANPANVGDDKTWGDGVGGERMEPIEEKPAAKLLIPEYIASASFCALGTRETGSFDKKDGLALRDLGTSVDEVEVSESGMYAGASCEIGVMGDSGSVESEPASMDQTDSLRDCPGVQWRCSSSDSCRGCSVSSFGSFDASFAPAGGGLSLES